MFLRVQQKDVHSLGARNLLMAKLPIPGETITSQTPYNFQTLLFYLHFHFNYPKLTGPIYVLSWLSKKPWKILCIFSLLIELVTPGRIPTAGPSNPYPVSFLMIGAVFQLFQSTAYEAFVSAKQFNFMENAL